MPTDIEKQPTNIPDAEVFKFLMEEIRQNMGLADIDTGETPQEGQEDETPEDPSKNKEPVA